MDQLSSLPDIILHNILSRLPETDVVRTSVLSKAWLEKWYTFPILSFHDGYILKCLPPIQDIEMNRNIVRKRNTLIFCDYVKKRMQRFCDQSLTIKEFKLEVEDWHTFGLPYMSKDVDVWLKLAGESGVEVIEISQDRLEGDRQYYVLPMDVILVKSLTKLVLKREIRMDLTFMNHSTKFFSLRVLTLFAILLEDERKIEHFISFCPLLEYITLEFCYVLNRSGTSDLLTWKTFGIMKSLSLNGLQKLKGVRFFGVQDVFIDAPSLEELAYRPGRMNTPFIIDFERCRNLKKLYFKKTKTFFTDKWFLEQFPKFPFLESLELIFCSMSKKIDISSVRLKILKLTFCRGLKEIKIDAPNLLLCEYAFTRSIPIIHFLRSSSQLEVNVDFKMHYQSIYNMKRFVQNIKPLNVLVSLSLYLSIFSPPKNVLVSMNYLFDWFFHSKYLLVESMFTYLNYVGGNETKGLESFIPSSKHQKVARIL
ncbi:F-box/FBD/LRR-repeat protein At2g04230-like [Cicer arietinum]|uniref:F-box/FBD/LRR-repeat protein At2g04230-like n=1 Tax=Cicer arietinum TaxID=3827 RepID=UPI003CC5F2E3